MIKIASSFTVLLFLAILTGCGDANFPGTSPKNNQLQDVTDRSSCKGSPQHGNSITDAWEMKTLQTKAGVTTNMVTTMRVSTANRSVTWSTTCTVPEGNSTASVTVSAFITSTDISLASGGAGSSPQDDIPCNVSLAAGVMQYQFVGNCLELQYNGQQLFLVHQ